MVAPAPASQILSTSPLPTEESRQSFQNAPVPLLASRVPLAKSNAVFDPRGEEVGIRPRSSMHARCASVHAAADGGGHVRGVQLAGYGKHAVGVCDGGETAGGADDEAAGASGGGDIKGF